MAEFNNTDCKVKFTDAKHVEWGRKEIELAEHEMPGLMALRKEFKGKQPLKRLVLRVVFI